MNEQQALAKMVRPGAHKPVWMGGVTQILLTRACNLACGGCSQHSQTAGKKPFMSLENFEKACINIAPAHTVVGVFGGNPCLHPQFIEICEIMRRYIPAARRGLWANRLYGHGKVCSETFNTNVSNINVHLDKEAASEFRRDWPAMTRILGEHEDSRHSPPLAAIQDMEDLDDSKRWDLISECPVNKLWSSLYGEIHGELRFWFCELAASAAMLHESDPDYPDTGMQVIDRVWDLPMAAYAADVRNACMRCGVAMNGYGEMATKRDGIELVSKTHIDYFKPKIKERLVQLVTNTKDAQAFGVPRMTDYIQNSHVSPKAN